MNDEHWDENDPAPLPGYWVPGVWIPWLILGGALVLALSRGCR